MATMPPADLGPRHVILLTASELTAAEPTAARLAAEGPKVGLYPVILREHYRELSNSCDYWYSSGHR